MEHPLDVRTLPRLPVPTSQKRAMEEFWRRRQEEIEATVNFSERAIPMARLKKVICAEKGSMMMTFDMPAFLSKACELFVQELAIRAWLCAESHHRCTILDSDITEAIASTESYDFLIDILHAHCEKHHSISHPKPTRKRRRPADQPSTHRYPPHHHQIPKFAPRIPIPTPPMATIFHHMPLSFPFLPQEASPLSATTVTSTPIATGQMLPTNYLPGCSDLFGNNIDTIGNNNALANIVDGNNSTARGATTTLPGPVRGLLNIPNIYFYMNMMSMMNAGATCGAGNAYGVGNASTSNVATEQGDLILPCLFNPPFTLQHTCPLPVANNNDPAIATTIELNHILPKGVETNTIHANLTASSYGDNDVVAAIGVDDGQQQQQEKETTSDDHQNVLRESVAAETIVVDGAEGNKYNIGGDEIEVFDESLLDKFLEEIQIDEDLLSPDTTSADFLSFINTIPDMEEWINDPYFLDDVFSNPSTSSK